MILCQELFCVSNAVSVQRELFPIAHDDLSLIHISALTVTIDGHINKDFYPADERGEDCIPWELQSFSKIKGLCFDQMCIRDRS